MKPGRWNPDSIDALVSAFRNRREASMTLRRFCEAVGEMNSLRQQSIDGKGTSEDLERNFRRAADIRAELEAVLLRILRPGAEDPVFSALSLLLECPIDELFRPALNKIASQLDAVI